jgi:1,4-dihydroxy-2-naphthoate octaprenyltransferase
MSKKKSNTSPPPTPLQVWLMAARPKTLPASIAPVLLGSAIAWYDGVFQLGPALAALAGGVLLQVGANLANDVFDFRKGADTKERLGPVRVTQAGLLTPQQVLAGMWAVFGLAALCGLYLTWVGGWPILAIGAAAIIAAIAYTAGPFPLAYLGLGEVFVVLFFGLAALGGTYYAQAGTISNLAWWSAVAIGLLVTNLIVVNNLRDIETDRKAGKMTLAVRLGPQGARVEYLVLMLLAYAIPVVLWQTGIAPAAVMLAWGSSLRAVYLTRLLWDATGRELNGVLAGTGLLALLYAALYAVGLIAERLRG